MYAYIVWKETNSIYECEVVRVEDLKSSWMCISYGKRQIRYMIVKL